jgi:hypothetical protein
MGMREEALKELARRELARREQARSGKPEIVEEMHPDVSFADRAIVKNFAQSPDKGAKYIKQQNPNLETRVYDGRVLVKDRNATKWNVLDPEGFDIEDISDIGYDVASGVAQAVALPTTGILGSAAAGAGAEALRQSLGAAAGIDQDLGEAAGDVALAGTLGGLIPAAGKAITPAAKKIAGLASQKAPAALSKIGRQSKEEIQTLQDNLGNLKMIEKEGVTPYVENIRGQAVEAVEDVTRKAGEDISNIISNTGAVNIAPAKEILRKRIDKLLKNYEANPTGTAADDLKAATDLYNEKFGLRDEVSGELFTEEIAPGVNLAIKETDDIVDASTAWTIKKDLQGASKSYNMQDDAFKSRHAKASSYQSQRTADSFLEAERKLNDQLDIASNGKIKEANKIYAEQKSLENDIKPIFKSVEKLERSLRTLGSDSNKVKAELLSYLDGNYGTNLIEASNKIRMANTFGKGSKNLEGLNVTSVTEQTPLSSLLGGIGGVIGWKTGTGQGAVAGAALGQALGKKLSSPKAIRKYVEGIVRTDKYAKVMDAKTKKWLQEELYKRITKGRALTEAVKASERITEDRG